MAKVEPWSTRKGTVAGLAIGVLLVLADLPDIAWEDLRLVLFCTFIGTMVPLVRNRFRKVGQWDPAEIAKNREGRL